MFDYHSEKRGPEPSAEQIVHAAREEWTLSAWAQRGGEILHAFRNCLMTGASGEGFMKAQRVEAEALSAVREELLPLVRQGLKIHEELLEQGIPEISADGRKGYISDLDSIRASLTPLIDMLADINSRIVEEWWSDIPGYGGSGGVRLLTKRRGQSPGEDTANMDDWLNCVQSQRRALVDSIEVMRAPESDLVQVVDLIKSAQQFFPRSAEWAESPAELSLSASCQKADIQFILSEVTKQVEKSILAAGFRGIAELLRVSREDEEFHETFEAYRARYFDLMVNRPDMRVEIVGEDTLSLACAVSAETRDDWIDELSTLRQNLQDAQRVAAKNGFVLSIEIMEYPSQIELSLSLPQESLQLDGEPASEHGPHLRLVRQSYTDTINFPVVVPPGVQSEPFQLPVKTQRSAFMSPEAVISFRDTLDAVSDYVSMSTRSWGGLSCAANCSITLNEDSFQHGFFECTLTGPPVLKEAMSEERLTDLYTFSWEEVPKSQLEFFNQWNARRMPKIDQVILPANSFQDDETRIHLARLSDRFKGIHLDLGVRSDLAALYSPEERVLVLKRLLESMVDEFVTGTEGDPFESSTLWGQGNNGGSCHECELFSFEVYNSEGVVEQCGAFSSTTFELAFRPHSYELERLALQRLQSVLDHFSRERSLQDLLSQQGLSIASASRAKLTEDIDVSHSGGFEAITSDPIRTMISVCRDPWNVMKMEGRQLHILDRGHPPRPVGDVSYGMTGFAGSGRPVTIFRQALQLYDVQQEGKNNGYTFEPSEQFYEKLERRDSLPLMLE